MRQRLALRLADTLDYTNFGVRSAAVPEMVPGRALVAGTRQVVQIARPAEGAGRGRRAAWPPLHPRRDPAAGCASSRSPPRCGSPTWAPWPAGARPWRIPVGVAERTRRPAGLVAYQGEHALIDRARPVGEEHRAAHGGGRRAGPAAPTARWWRSPGPARRWRADPLVDEVVAPARDRRAA